MSVFRRREDLFTPCVLPHITLPGRIVRSATEFFCSAPDGHIRAFELDAYRKLSAQPLGMIISAHTCVSPEGHANPYQNAAWDDTYMPDLAALCETAGKHGVPVVLQLGHGGMKALGHNGGLPVFTPDTMSPGDIRSVVRAFGEAAKRAKAAGFSGVMVHAAHLYLLSQFLYPEFNHRTDAYGGTPENRFRITLEAIAEIKTACGTDYPVFMKINATDRSGDPAYLRDIAALLEPARQAGLEAAEISGWNSAPRGVPKAPYFLEEVRFLRNASDLPLIEVGGFRNAAGMLSALNAGACAVSLSRPFIREPGFAERIRTEEDAVSLCAGCCACFRPLEDGAAHRCAIACNKESEDSI